MKCALHFGVLSIRYQPKILANLGFGIGIGYEHEWFWSYTTKKSSSTAKTIMFAKKILKRLFLYLEQWVVMRKNYPAPCVFPIFFSARALQRKWFMFILRSEKPWKSLIRCLEDVTINKVDSSFPSFPLHILQWLEWTKVCPFLQFWGGISWGISWEFIRIYLEIVLEFFGKLFGNFLGILWKNFVFFFGYCRWLSTGFLDFQYQLIVLIFKSAVNEKFFEHWRNSFVC